MCVLFQIDRFYCHHILHCYKNKFERLQPIRITHKKFDKNVNVFTYKNTYLQSFVRMKTKISLYVPDNVLFFIVINFPVQSSLSYLTLTTSISYTNSRFIYNFNLLAYFCEIFLMEAN